MNSTIRIKPLYHLGWRYSVSLLAVAIALSLQLFLTPFGELESPFLLCLAAVMVSAWYGGRGAGIFATVLAALSGGYLVLSPTYSLGVDSLGQTLRLVLFVLEGLFLSSTISGLTIAREQVICGQEALIESEEKFRLVAESLPQIVWTAQSNGSVDYYNQRWAEYSGISPQQGQGWGWKPVLHPDDEQKTTDAWNHALEMGELYECEHRLRRADGEFRWHLSRAFPLRDSHGKIIKWFGTATEIHQQKQTEAQLRESQELFQNFMDYSPVAAYIKEESGHYIFVNRLVENRCDRPLIDWLGKTDFDLFSDAIAQQIRENDVKALAGDHAIELQETLENGNGIHYYLSYKFPLKTASGQRWLAGMSMEITERQQMEEALRHSEQRFRQAVINAPYPLIIHAEDGEVLQINQMWTELTGYNHSDIPTMADWTEKAYGERREVVRERIDQLYALNDKFHDGEFAIATKQGSRRVWDFSSAPLGKLPDGRRTIISIATDISDRILAEELLRGQKQILEAIATNVPLSDILDTITQLIESHADESICAVLLLDEQKKRLHYGSAGRLPERFQQVTNGLAIGSCAGSCGTAAYRNEPVIVCDIANNPLWADYKDIALSENLAACWSIPLHSSNGDVLGTFAMYYPTPRHPSAEDWNLIDQFTHLAEIAIESSQAKQALKASQERLQRFAESDLIGILFGDIYGGIQDVNDTFLNIVGYNREDLQVGRLGWRDITPPEYLPLDEVNIAQAKEKGRCIPYEKECIRQDGTRVWVLVGYVLLGEARDEAVAFILDISDRKQSEAILQRQSQELAQANRLKDEFLATLSHELRTPLNSILGLAKLLPMRRLNEEKMARALETISRNTQSLAQLIEDVLDMSDIITGELTLDVSPVELMPIIERAIASIRAAAEAKTLQIETHLDTDVAPILGDASRLQQIVWNLLSNAVKFTPKGGQIQVRLEQIEDQAQIQVSDTGIGIHGDVLPFVFDRFRQGDGSLTRSHGGIGMGLAIVRYLVELQGGTVWAESPGSGQGATFTVRFPIFAGDKKAEGR
ncbi:PAS domain S-box protein [Coleofasciculus sp. E2-BRE-01]|uniref:PAS domain S-box protein n=1 Tax=Coleofasciculus sp. E2-BRE-01 TaxID=3069524 RepID=UPI0032F68D8F